MTDRLAFPRSLVALAMLLTAVPVWAQGGAERSAGATLPFDAALERAVEVSASVRSAALDLTTAERDLERVTSDPTTLRVARLQAEHARARAAAALAAALETARDAAAGAYEAALEGDDQVAVAEAALAIAQGALEAARIRFAAGAATRIELDRAENDALAAARDVEDATQARTLAYRRLASLLDIEDDDFSLSPAPSPGAVPDLEDVRSWAADNRNLLAADQQVELAEAQLAAIDVPLATPRADIEAARDRLETARLQRDERRRLLDLDLRQALNAAAAAAARLASAEEARATAEEDVRVQRLRFEAGTIAQLTLAQSELQRTRQEAARSAAEHALAAALRRLRLTAMGAGL